MLTCPSCGAVIEDSNEHDDQMGDSIACQQCGVVVSSGKYHFSDSLSWSTNYTPSGDFGGYNSLPSKYVSLNKAERTPCPGYLATIKQLRCFASAIGLKSEMLKGSEHLFESVYHSPTFKNVFLSKKVVMAGVCIYIVCRQNNWPLTLKFMSETIGCSPSEFVSMKKQVMSDFSIVIPSLSVEEHVNVMCQSRGFEHDKLASIQQVVQLCRKVWLVDGRPREPIIIVSAYLVWKAENCVERMKTTFPQFCKTFSFTVGGKSSTTPRLGEITNALLALGSQIPWVTASQMNKRSLPFYLQDILKYQNSLLVGAIRSAKVECPDKELTPGIKKEPESRNDVDISVQGLKDDKAAVMKDISISLAGEALTSSHETDTTKRKLDDAAKNTPLGVNSKRCRLQSQ